jgi:hypothetical protein
MKEALDQWDFVVAAYAVAVGGTLMLTAWSWSAMIKAERRRDRGRGR